MACYALFERLRAQRQKEFKYFVCHHKEGTGCFARLIKMAITEASESFKGKVFIDCDNLTDLDNLFDTIATNTETLVVLCSRRVLMRPWCVGEMCTARIHKVGLVKIIMQDFVPPDDSWIRSYQDHVSDLSVLTSRGMTLTWVQDTFRWLGSQPELVMPEKPSKHTIDHLTARLVQTPDTSKQELLAEADGLPDTNVFVVLDHENFEAIATGHILCMLLKEHFIQEHFIHDVGNLPFILPRETKWPPRGDSLMLLCTRGCLQQEFVLRAIGSTAQSAERLLPILADEDFCFPKQGAFLRDNSSLLAQVT